jgi:hypothetical protein
LSRPRGIAVVIRFHTSRFRARRTADRLATALAAATACLGSAVSTDAHAAPRADPKPIRVTFVGDSVPASIDYTPAAQARLRRGLVVRLDLEVCRRLVRPSCVYKGYAPSTALQAVQAYGSALGDVLIVNVGYNESAKGYAAGIDRVMRAALREGAAGVVWVTLRETRSTYHRTNVSIRSATRRWPQLVVADWNAYSHGKAWFGNDGLHLSRTGATHLANFLRGYVFEAARL